VGGLAVFAAVVGASTSAAAAESPQRATGAEVEQAAGATALDPDAGAAETYVPMPDLGIAHRAPDGGINLYRMSLSELEDDYGTATPVRKLTAGSGFAFDHAKVVAGDFGDITPGDDGTADHVIWLALPDGGVRVWMVGGGTDTVPRSMQVLRASTGWSWANSRPMAGDVNGDGWDDLVVVHRLRVNSAVWVLLSNGTTLGAPQRWGTAIGDFGSTRNYVADVDGDFNEDLLTTGPGGSGVAFTTSVLLTKPDGTGSTGTTEVGASFPSSGGWSLAYSRQLVGDVTGEGLPDLVTVHRNGTGGVVVWVSANCAVADGAVCFGTPSRWQNLSGGGWSFANSRQYLADTDGDYVDDLVSMHRTASGGMVAWVHPNTGTTFGTPLRLADLTASSGWNWSLSRESVADTWGVLGP
jgi:hypothetical protein